MRILLHENLQGVNTSSFISDLKKNMAENFKELPKEDGVQIVFGDTYAETSAQFDDIEIFINTKITLTSINGYETMHAQISNARWVDTWLKNACSHLFERVEIYTKACEEAVQQCNIPSGSTISDITVVTTLGHAIKRGKESDLLAIDQVYVKVQLPDKTFIEDYHYGARMDAQFSNNKIKEASSVYSIEEFVQGIAEGLQLKWEIIEAKRKRASKSRRKLQLNNDQLDEIWTALGEIISDNPWYSSTLSDGGTESDDPEVQEMIDLQDKIDAAIDGKKKLTQKDIRRALEICQDNGREFDFAE